MGCLSDACPILFTEYGVDIFGKNSYNKGKENFLWEGIAMITAVKSKLSEAIGAEPLLDRAYLYLEDGEREKAKEYFEKVLDKNPRSPFSYLGRLLIATEMADVTDLLLWETSYTEHPDFVKVLRFTEGELHDTLAGIAAERDRIAAVYGRAKEIEAGATDKAAFAEAYALYCEVRDFADAEDRLEMILDAASVTAYYAEKARARIENHLAGIKTACKTLRDKADALTAAVVQTKKTVAELPKAIEALTAERDALGLFKGKRKRELTVEIGAAEARLATMNGELEANRAEIRKISSKLAKLEPQLKLGELLGGEPQGSETYAKDKNVDENPNRADMVLTVYTDDEKPLALLKNADLLAIVARDPAALYAILLDEAALAVVNATEKSAAAVGASLAFPYVAELAMDVVKKCDKLIPHLPLKERLSVELARGDVITFGMFPKDGIDPYADIIPLPGTPYERPGKPVQWTVLSRSAKGKLVTLICNRPLLSRQVEPTGRRDVTWGNCEMHKYMQGEMFNLLFDSEERALISTCEIHSTDRVSGKESALREKILLPSYEEVGKVRSLLPADGYIWTRDKFEIIEYGSSLLVKLSVYSLKHDEAWHLLVHEGVGILPVIMIDLR